MISLQARVKELLSGTCANVYYFYPASWTRLPCVSWRESGNRELHRADGREHLAELTYTVDIWSSGPNVNADLASAIDAQMASARFRRTYSADIFDTSARLHHRVMRYRAVADSSGSIYQ